MGKPAELDPFAILSPRQWTRPVIFNSPHSGRIYPADFLAASRLNPHALRKSEDCYIDELFSFVAELGSPLLHAHFPRAYLDVNREPYELDPRMFREELPGFANVSSMRVAGGLGTIPRIVSRDITYRDVLIPAGTMLFFPVSVSGRDPAIDNADVFNDKLREWEDYYNYHRPHGGLGGQTPYERLKQKTATRA